MAALATLAPVAVHQLGFLRHLPDPPSPLFDSDAITGSRMAHPYGVPDGLLGLGSYGATLLLLIAARRRAPLAGRLLGAKLALDAGAATFNSVRQVAKFHRVCSWCAGTAVATAVMTVYGYRFLRD